MCAQIRASGSLLCFAGSSLRAVPFRLAELHRMTESEDHVMVQVLSRRLPEVTHSSQNYMPGNYAVRLWNSEVTNSAAV